MPYAALLVGNAAAGLPFVPLFPAIPAYGLGSPTPPTVLRIERPLGDLWGSGVTIPAGTELQFRIRDINNGDNSGTFLLTSTFTATVPEPATAALLVVPALMLLRRRRC